MRIWIASFVVLFALAEFFQWLKDFSLPLPIFILGGVFLAIASNYEKLTGLSSAFTLSEEETLPLSAPRATPATPTQPPRPISFTIRRPTDAQP